MPIAKSAGKTVFGDIIGGLIYAPIFWYTRGAMDSAKYCLRLIVRRWKLLGVGVWIKNIFVPMYGQRDIAGALISFFMRVVQIIVRFIAFIFSLLFIIILYLAYLVVPILIFIQLVRQIVGLFSA